MSKQLKQGDQKQRLVLPDASGRCNDICADINWNEASKRKYVRLSLGGKEAIIKKDHLLTILFMIGSAKEQDAIISPFVKQTLVTKFSKLIGITTTRDVRKGEQINVALEFTFNPETNKLVVGKGNKYGLTHNRVKKG